MFRAVPRDACPMLRTARLALLVAVLPAGVAWACAECEQDDAPPPAKPVPTQTAEVKITEGGIEPRALKVKAGVLLRLKVTRLTQRACTAGFSVQGDTDAIELPVGVAVEIELTHANRGRVALGCGKARGTLIAE